MLSKKSLAIAKELGPASNRLHRSNTVKTQEYVQRRQDEIASVYPFKPLINRNSRKLDRKLSQK